MARGEQKIDFSGFLDKDTAPEKLAQGNYTSAKNIQFLTGTTESTRSHVPMLGNVPAFDLGNIVVQGNKWRFYTKQQNGVLVNLNYTSPNGITTFITAIPIPLPIPTQAGIIQAGINFFLGTGVATVTSTGTTDGFIDIDFIGANAILGHNAVFFLSPTSTSPVVPDFTHLELIREAYDTTLAGELHTIGSYDLLGDLYVWSTTGVNLPLKKTLSVSSITLVLVGTRMLYRVNFASVHGLSIGQSVSLIANTSLATDGTWVVSSSGFSTTSIVLEDYISHAVIALPANTTMTATLYENSIGEVGVGQYNANTDLWTYTRLGRTKQWGFRTKKQIDTYCEQTAVKSSIYWTDDFNVPRSIYYIFDYDINENKAAFVPDGIITDINSSGLYTYATIEIESRLQITESGAVVKFIKQLQSGGQLASGNWRYAARFLTDNLVATTTTDITNPVNVYSADVNGSATLIIGDEPEIITSKINQIRITGILPGLFKYIELIGINYVGDAVVGFIIRRDTLNSTQTSIDLNHTGTETETRDFDLGLLNQQFELIETAKNIDVIDKRMILSNLTTKQKLDFTAWAKTIKYGIGRKSLNAVGDSTSTTLRMGEYQDPQNVYNNVGYMHNETYRFGVKLRLKNGAWTDVFHVDDITINCNQTTTNGRRLFGLADFNLTDNTSGGADNILFSAFVSFAIGIAELDFLVDGKRVRDLINGISFVRAEVNPTILACGVGILGISCNPSTDGSLDESGFDSAGTAITYEVSPDNNFVGPSNPNRIIEFPFASGRTSSAPPPTIVAQDIDYPTAAPTSLLGDWRQRREYAAFYSPDIQFGHTSIGFISGDKVINFGNPAIFKFNHLNSDNLREYSNYGQYSGRTNKNSGIAPQTPNPPITVTLTDAQLVAKGSSFTTGTQTFFKVTQLSQGTTPALLGTSDNASGMVFLSNGTPLFDNPPGSGFTPTDYGIYYMQYFRALTDQYGDTENTQYIPTGHLLEMTATYTGSSEIVFGGDTFTQNNYFRHRFSSSFSNTGGGGGLSFYSQNRINAQMKNKTVITGLNLYPALQTVSWLETVALDNEIYQEGYTIRNEVQSDIAFDPDLQDTNDQPSRIRWSGIKPQGSSSDQYKIYLPLDFHDLDQSFGEIIHHANGNGELLTWQQRAFMRQYFNTRGTLEIKGITEILIGDGSVMSRDGVTVSKLGSKHKWAIIKGKSTGGNDVFYWINTELKKTLRFGYDGTVSIADIKGMQSFLANNLKWADAVDTPADGQGICGTWDDRYANVIWTIRARINPAQSFGSWSSLVGYQTGDKVFFSSDIFSVFGDVYISIDLQNNIGNQPDLFPLKWTKQGDDGTYFNAYTLVFNEFKNAFICDAAFKPKIYLKWTDTFLSPRPISPESKIYQHNKGKYLWWYENTAASVTTKQTERAHIEGVINQFPDETKWFEAIGVDSEITPIRAEFKTKNHASFLIQSEFRTREDSSFSPIKKDSTTTGINSANTTSLFGKWCKIKTFFEIDVYQSLSNIVCKFRISPRVKTK